MLLQSGLPVEYEVLLQEGPRHKPTWTVQAQVVVESGTGMCITLCISNFRP